MPAKHAPDWLTEEGRRYWKKNLSSIPPDANLDTFAMLADVWARWRATNADDPEGAKQAVKWTTQYMAMAKLFGLYPGKQATKKPEPKAKGEFDDL